MIMVKENNTMTSLELVEQVNIFRREEGNRAELQHRDLLKIIRDEFEEEINEGKISPVTYKDKKGEDRPMFELTTAQAKQVLMRESKFVRKAMIKYIENLEGALQQVSNKEKLLLGLFSNDPMIVADSHKKLVELETKPLIDKIEQDKPKVNTMNAILEQDKYFDGAELAKMLNLKGVGRNLLFEYMRYSGMLLDNNEPVQRYVSNGCAKYIPVQAKNGYITMKPMFSIRMVYKLQKESEEIKEWLENR